MIPEYSGSMHYILNSDIPDFTAEQLKITEPHLELREDLDELGRCNGSAFAVLNKESTEFVGPRPDDLKLPNPTGWKQSYYSPNIVSNGTLYDRSHLIGRLFCGIDNKYNLIIGTKYFNQLEEKGY